jgi:hypothetical protein
LIAAFALISLGVAKVAVVASPAVLPVPALALVAFRVPSPIVLVQARSASFHGVSSRIAHMAGLAGPIVLPVAAFALKIHLDIDFAISAVPIAVHQ